MAIIKDLTLIHEREVEFYPEQEKFIGFDKILKKNVNKGC